MTHPKNRPTETRKCAKHGLGEFFFDRRWRCRACRRVTDRKWNRSAKGRERSQRSEATESRRAYKANRNRKWNQKRAADQRHSRAHYSDQRAARAAVAQAIRSGKLIRPERCVACGKTPPPKIGAVRTYHGLEADHHLGYAKENWLKVQWLCSQCHSDKDNRGRGGAVLWYGPDPLKWPSYINPRAFPDPPTSGTEAALTI